MSFYDFDEYERLVAAASSVDRTAHLIVLLGGEAGLRCGAQRTVPGRRPTVDPANGAVPRATSVASSEGVAGGVHILRHTFCSHLAMRGAPPRAIQELAGHRELGMMQRYMHLSPAALDSTIRLLDQPVILQNFGDLGETGTIPEGKING